MKSFAISALLSCIATAKSEREHASLAQLMMLHDEMVAKLDQPNNDVENKGMWDRFMGGEEEKKPAETTDVTIKVEETDSKMKPRESQEERYKGKDPARVDVPGREGKEKKDVDAPGLEQRVVDTRCPDLFEFIEKADGQKACIMPDSYHVGHGYTEPCTHCDYSYGRWFDKCDEFFVRNGCCVCTPYCPDGMIMSYWSWPQRHPDTHANALEPRSMFNEATKDGKKRAPAPAEKKVSADGTVAGYVCLIHDVEK